MPDASGSYNAMLPQGADGKSGVRAPGVGNTTGVMSFKFRGFSKSMSRYHVHLCECQSFVRNILAYMISFGPIQ